MRNWKVDAKLKIIYSDIENLQNSKKPLKLSKAIRDFNNVVSAKSIYQNKQNIYIYMCIFIISMFSYISERLTEEKFHLQ